VAVADTPDERPVLRVAVAVDVAVVDVCAAVDGVPVFALGGGEG
jgi:L-alanine-DL-glutamate epimerase-like enolase superfamily enzyme